MHEAKPVNCAKVEPLWKVKHTVRIGQGASTCTTCEDRPGRNTVCPGCGKEGR